MKGEGDKGFETSRNILLFPQSEQVHHPLFRRLHMAEKERRVGADAQAMGLPMNLQPTIRRNLIGKKRFPDPFREDFGAASRHGGQPGVLQTLEAIEGGNSRL